MADKYYRSVFVADLHLGSSNANTSQLLKFLRSFECDFLYIIGNAFTKTAFENPTTWLQIHNDIANEILTKTKNGTEVVYIPVGTDTVLKRFANYNFGNIQIKKEVMHTGEDGKIYLILHGDILYKNTKSWSSHLKKLFNSQEDKIFEDAVCAYAMIKDADGVICANGCVPNLQDSEDELIYMNPGSCIENCTAIVEYSNGEWQLFEFK